MLKTGKTFAVAGSLTDHGGFVMPMGCSINVFINKKPAARLTSLHSCPRVTPGSPPVPHGIGMPVVSPGVKNVLINGIPAIGEGDRFLCIGAAPAKIKKGNPKVVFGARSQTPMETAVGGNIIDNDVNNDNKETGSNNKNTGNTEKRLSPFEKAKIALALADGAADTLNRYSNNCGDRSYENGNAYSVDSMEPESDPPLCDVERTPTAQYGQARADAAKTVIEKYQSNATAYSQNLRMFGLDAAYADCSSTTVTALREAGQGGLFKEMWTGGGSGGGIQGEIRNIAKVADIRAPYRIKDPCVGDIMMWTGHIAIVTDVTEEHVKWANMGNSGARIGSAKLKDIKTDAEKWTTGFWGFWTPPDHKI